MPRLSKKAKQEWAFFIHPETGRRTYNDLCRKCSNTCKQSYKTVIIAYAKYCSKKGAKTALNRSGFDNTG